MNSEFKAVIERIDEVPFSGSSRARTTVSGKEGMARKEADSRWGRELTEEQADGVRRDGVRERGARRGARVGKGWRVARLSSGSGRCSSDVGNALASGEVLDDGGDDARVGKVCDDAKGCAAAGVVWRMMHPLE